MTIQEFRMAVWRHAHRRCIACGAHAGHFHDEWLHDRWRIKYGKPALRYVVWEPTPLTPAPCTFRPRLVA